MNLAKKIRKRNTSTTSCCNTSPRNGVVEKKNHHLLEVTRSLTFTMNVPKFLTTYLINQMPSRELAMKTPYEMIYGKMSSLFRRRCLGVHALLETIDLPLENWIHVM
jgi:hypothetical protein